MARALPPLPPPGLLVVYAELTGPQGRTLLRLALDTGATYTMLPPDKLLVAGYAPVATRRHVEIMTASGAEITPILTVTRLRFLGLTVRQLEVVAHPLPPTSPVEGLLGLNALRHFPPFRSFCRQLRHVSS